MCIGEFLQTGEKPGAFQRVLDASGFSHYLHFINVRIVNCVIDCSI